MDGAETHEERHEPQPHISNELFTATIQNTIRAKKHDW